MAINERTVKNQGQMHSAGRALQRDSKTKVTQHKLSVDCCDLSPVHSFGSVCFWMERGGNWKFLPRCDAEEET